MISPFYGDESRIVALATPVAESALALIRCSGAGTLEAFSGSFSRHVNNIAANRIVHGWILNQGEKIDEVLVSIFHAPHSYTGEDSVEIACHGGRAVVNAVLHTLRNAGFRDALPGEFSFRAFVNGKMDLTRAESVMELVSAQSDQARIRAVQRLSGYLEQDIKSIRDSLVSILAAIEITLDYPEEDLDDVSAVPDQIAIEYALSRLEQLAESYHRERLYQNGFLVVIAGCPNAGKSSLFNRLIHEERSIVSEVPGTTRDWIEAYITVESVPIRLVDTAGLHIPTDSVEKMGIERSWNLLSRADAVVYVIDGTQGVTPEDQDFLSAQKPVLPVWNKVDQAPVTDSSFFPVSARTGYGIQELCQSLAGKLDGAHPLDDHVGIATERQKILVDRACENLRASQNPHQTLDLIAPLIRDAIDALGEITGEVTTAEILETMFSRFCVGK
ncbi:tRNA modification GTPase MnmE [Spirochaetia bacterium]|nr:tRNA modification GTPase MnmE [Spirochaetia bacterium]